MKKLLLIALLTFSVSANAALVSRLGGLAYYDTDADLTWLADANINGSMNWQGATDWASQLTVADVGGWRLPDTIDVGNDGATYTNIYQGVDFGYNITNQSELSNMFYNVLGNTAAYDTSGVKTGCSYPNNCLTNTGPFSNLQFNNLYWSSEVASDNSSAWYFSMNDGMQSAFYKGVSGYAWAVQSGDVEAVSAVPIPAAVWLFGTGVIGLVGVARRKHK